MEVPDYYKILQIANNSSLIEIKKAYRRLARVYHPDVSTLPDARERFIEINEAYEYLLNKVTLEEGIKHRHEFYSEETAQSIIDAWIIAERERIRERARRHSNMRYQNFKKTNLYRTTEILTTYLSIGSLLLGVVVLLGPLFGTWIQWKNGSSEINAGSIFNVCMVCSIGVIMTTYSAYKIRMSLKLKKKF
jgi:curved DNA-binding protein CbpA